MANDKEIIYILLQLHNQFGHKSYCISLYPNEAFYFTKGAF